MQHFTTLEIQKNVEEKRFILGKKLEVFLLKKLVYLSSLVQRALSAPSFAVIASLFIIALSVLIRSSRDIGHDSGFYLEAAGKFLSGKKYYDDIFENNLPLAFYFTAIPYFLAELSGQSKIIFLEIFVNLVGVLSIYSSTLIIKRADFSKDRTIFNLLVISFCSAFFLRVFTLQFNEFATKSTYFLAFAFPYICYQFLQDSQLKNFDRFIIGLCAAVIFCLKPHYGILVLVFEIRKVFSAKSLKPLFSLQNYSLLFFVAVYFLILWFYFPTYISAIPVFSATYFNKKYFLPDVIIKRDIFPLLIFIIFCRFLSKNQQFLKIIFLAPIAAAATILAELIAGYDQRFILYSLALPAIVLSVLLLIRNGYINWRRDFIFLLPILFLPIFDIRNSFAMILDIPAFWWVFVICISLKWRKILPDKNFASAIFLNKIFLPRDLISWFYFLVLAVLQIVLFFCHVPLFSWIIAAVFFVLMVNFYQELHDKFYGEKKFSTLTTCVVFMVVSYFLTLNLAMILDLKNYESSYFKSPNYFKEQMALTIKENSKNSSDVVIISSGIYGTYPLLNYLKKTNPLLSAQLLVLYTKITENSEMNKGEKHLLSNLEQQLENPQNKLVFVENKKYALDGMCNIGFLEKYFFEKKFKEAFLKNYVFLNRIIERRIVEKKVEFFDEQNSEISPSSQIIEKDVEVYIRK